MTDNNNVKPHLEKAKKMVEEILTIEDADKQNEVVAAIYNAVINSRNEAKVSFTEKAATIGKSNDQLKKLISGQPNLNND